MSVVLIPDEGSLSEVSPAEILASLAERRISAVVELIRGQVRRTLGFHRGTLISMNSNALSDSFARVVESTGRITAEQGAQLRRDAHNQGVGQEQWALSQGLLTEEEVARFLKLQGQVRIVSTLGWADGTYRIIGGAAAFASPDMEGQQLAPLVLQHLRRKNEPGLVRASLARRGVQRPHLRPEADLALANLGLTADEFNWLRSIDGARTVRELLGNCGLPAEQAGVLLYTLYVSGLLNTEDLPRSVRAQPAVMAPPPAVMAPPPPPAVMAPPPPAVMAPPPPPAVMAPPPPAVMAPPPSVVMAPPPPPAVMAPTAAVLTSSTPVARPAAMSIEDLITEEVGELQNPIPTARKASDRSIVDFSMSGFSEAQITLANRLREDYLKMNGQNYFEWLGVDRQLGSAEIRKAYFQKAKEYHSDRLVGQPPQVQALGNELFTMLQMAYETLTDSSKREAYVSATFYNKTEHLEEEAAIARVQTILQADVFYKRGNALSNAGNIKAAVTAFQKAVELYPREPEYKAALGFALFRMNYPRNEKQCEEAERMIYDAIKENTKLDRGHLYLGRISLAKADPEQARKHFYRALKANEKNVEAMREIQALQDWVPEQSGGIISNFFARFKK